MKKVIVIGGGAAGMMAALISARAGNTVTLIEKNEKLGKKIYITGKGRCNLTNTCDKDDLFKNVVHNSKFMYSAFNAFDNIKTVDFFESLGLKTKTERGSRVFPVSDHSSDVIKVLQQALIDENVDVKLNTKVLSLIVNDSIATGIKTDKGVFKADKIILATGGISYPTTGSTGDGIRFAKDCNHDIKELIPSLVPFNVKEEYVSELMGLSLKNVEISIFNSKKKLLYKNFGEMLFTHFGLSGPIVISASAVVNDKIKDENLYLYIDLKPAISKEELDSRLIKEFDENKNKLFANAVTSLFPGKLTPVMVKLSGIDPQKKVCEVTKKERTDFVYLIKHMPFTLTSLRDFNEAIVTRGGVSVKDINPKTMESKKIKNLFFAGEMIDVDAFTGGFNLQVAWSTGYVAGSEIE
ncbi:MAG: NAD(P)/FAD-dependent oxidoreductase [Lachnospiraceae bacterium]|nr:NAD(P)/FAD-dependent oxidoreductase [Lachnospiraceae bacterium]